MFFQSYLCITQYNNRMQELSEQSNTQQLHLPQEQKYPKPHLKPLPPPNYIKQYFETSSTTTPPQVSLPHLYQKLHYLKSLFIQPINNFQVFLLQKYPIGLPITLTEDICPEHQQLEKKISRIKKSDFSYFLKYLKPQGFSIYYGQMQNEKKHGYGIYAQYSQKKGQEDVTYFYEGFFCDGHKQGMAVQWDENIVYFGRFKDNFHLPQKKSVVLYQNGDIYMGGVVRGKKHGKGTYFQSRNRPNQFTKYQSSRKALDYQQLVLGFWEQDIIKPKTATLMKSTLTSIFRANLLNFEQNWLILSNSIYCGDLKQLERQQQKQTHFIREGKGFEYFSNGDVYRGQYSKDRPQGFGSYLWKNGDQYTGQFVGGLRQGKGRWTGSNGQIFQGEYIADKRCGFGIYKWPNGNIYEGEFQNDLRDGYGKMVWINGEVYTGHWKKGLQHGQGEIRVNLNFTSLHKKFMFDRGCRVRKMKKNTSLSSIKNIQSLDKLSNKLSNMNKVHQKNMVQQRRQSLSELKSIQKNSLGKIRKQKTHEPFPIQKTNKGESQHKTYFTSNNNTIEEKVNQLSTIKHQKHTITIQDNQQILLKSRSVQIKLGNKQKNQKKDKAIPKLKNLKMKSNKPRVQLGQTLLRPIKWNNFKQVWQYGFDK